MAQPQPARASVFGLMRSQPSEMDRALILTYPPLASRTWQPALRRLPPPR